MSFFDKILVRQEHFSRCGAGNGPKKQGAACAVIQPNYHFRCDIQAAGIDVELTFEDGMCAIKASEKMIFENFIQPW